MIKIHPSKANIILNAACRKKLGVFTQRAFHTVDPGAQYLHNWHIDCISEYLEACTKGDIKRLIINIPPRYMKSISVTVAWPAWLLGNDPSRRILASSYSAQLSTKHSLDSRHLMQSSWYKECFPDVAFASDENQKTRFQTTQQGHRIATSVGGSSTGEGGDFLIVDDPHNPLQAASDVQRLNALTWFDQTFTTRLNDKKNGVIVIVMQRLHQEDLTGHLLKKTGWDHLCIPAEAESNRTISIGNFKKEIKEGEILHAEREGEKELTQLKEDLGSYGYAGQYMQRPAPAGGNIFKEGDFKWYSNPRKYKRIIASWDTAFKANQINDPSVCTVWGEHEGGFDLLDVSRQRLEYPALKKKAKTLAEHWTSVDMYAGHRLFTILIEDKGSGQSLIQDLRNETNYSIVPIQPEGDKIIRASTCSPMVESGKVFLKTGASWVQDYVDEMIIFPNVPHDDQVDSTSQFLNWVSSSSKAKFNDLYF